MKKFNRINVKLFAMAVFAMLANAAVAQNLKVTRGGEPVANGDVIELKWEYEEDSVPEFDLYSYLYTWDPHLEVSTVEGDAQLTVTITSIDGTDGFQICWPSTCTEVGPNETKSVSGSINQVPKDLDIHKKKEFDDPNKRPTEGGTIKLTLTCGSESVEVTVKALLEGDTGVGTVSSDSVTEYYTIQGIRVDVPRKGQLYIERNGGKATKRVF